jgi:hypothetical protein
MSALLEIIAFFVDHGVWVAAGSALAVGVAMLAPMALSRQTLRRFTQHTASTTPPSRLSASTAPTAPSDPMELLRSFSRARGSYVVMVPPAQPENQADEDADLEVGRTSALFERLTIDLQAIPKSMPIDILLHHRSGLSLPQVRIVSKFLLTHEGKVTVIVPFRVFGPVCNIALAADQIVMSEDAALVFDTRGVKQILKAANLKTQRRMSDQGLMKLHEIKQIVRETEWLIGILIRRRRPWNWRNIAKRIAGGQFTNGAPARAADLKAIGLDVVTRRSIDKHELAEIDPSATISFADAGGRTARPIQIAPTCEESCPIGEVRDAMQSLQQRRKTKLICIVHAAGTREGMVADQTIAETLKAIRTTPPDTDLDIILHTPGGDALGADQIARALKAHKGRKVFFVPYEAFSAGTILALTGDEIYLSDMAMLGPIDTQFNRTPIARLAYPLQHKPARRISDEVLQTALYARDRIKEDHRKAMGLMKGNYSRGRASRIAHTLNDGHLSHSFPIMYEEARKIGLNVRFGVPDEVFTIVDSFLTDDDDFCSVIHCPD